jgi:hypothetical protein
VTIGTFYFFGFIGSLQHMMSQASTQPQTVSTETTSPQARQANLLPFVTAFFFVVVAFFAGAIFFVFVAKALPPLIIVYCRLVITRVVKPSLRFLASLRMTLHLSVSYQFLSNYKNFRKHKQT